MTTTAATPPTVVRIKYGRCLQRNGKWRHPPKNTQPSQARDNEEKQVTRCRAHYITNHPEPMVGKFAGICPFFSPLHVHSHAVPADDMCVRVLCSFVFACLLLLPPARLLCLLSCPDRRKGARPGPTGVLFTSVRGHVLCLSLTLSQGTAKHRQAAREEKKKLPATRI